MSNFSFIVLITVLTPAVMTAAFGSMPTIPEIRYQLTPKHTDDCPFKGYKSISEYNQQHQTNYEDRAELSEAATVILTGDRSFEVEECR